MRKRCLPILAMLGVLHVVCVLGTSSWGVCTEDPNDPGQCDTIYLAPWPADTLQQGQGPYFVRVPLFVTTDLVSWQDSIAAFVLPLCITHSNPSKYCSVSAYWNTTSTLYLYPDFSTRSIFRHIVEGEDTLRHNRMADMAADLSGEDWDFRVVNVESDSSWFVYSGGTDSLFVPPHFWLALHASGVEDHWWWEGSEVLLATMTFKLEDTMQICLDGCFWPPTGRLMFSSGWGEVWFPRLGTPHDPVSYRFCFNVRRSDSRERPSAFALFQNYPNPFNQATRIEFTLANPGFADLTIYDILGRKVRTLVSEHLSPGYKSVSWDGRNDSGKDVASGVYFYRMEVEHPACDGVGGPSQTRKLVLLK